MNHVRAVTWSPLSKCDGSNSAEKGVEIFGLRDTRGSEEQAVKREKGEIYKFTSVRCGYPIGMSRRIAMEKDGRGGCFVLNGSAILPRLTVSSVIVAPYYRQPYAQEHYKFKYCCKT